MSNRLYFGDCLDVMREDISDESVDLVYLDPPFNSKRLYNAFIGGAQWVAFDDTWRWHEAVDDFHDVAQDVSLSDTMEGLKRILGESSNLAYLSYMANRLRECRRVLKSTGSIYLHCDPTMSHYLKVVMDGVFGESSFRNEITWKRTGGAHNDARQWGRIADSILFYSKTRKWKWHTQYTPYDREYINQRYRTKDQSGRMFYPNTMTAAGDGPPRVFRGQIKAPPSGTHWRYSQEKIDQMEQEDRLYYSSTGMPYVKSYLDERRGKTVQNIWTDVVMSKSGKERLDYPTQKPMALLERILKASSEEGDVVLDPFCGCGTTIEAAQGLGRQWIGIDICVNACKVIERRFRDRFDSVWSDVEFIGMPKTSEDARTLADMDKFRFERWAASLVDGMEANKKQRGDKGIDGRGRIPIRKGQFIDIVSQVKGGGTGPGDVQAFNGARQQAGADLGIFTCFEDRVTHNMRNAAVSAGRFMDVPVVQIFTVEDFFDGRQPLMPKAA